MKRDLYTALVYARRWPVVGRLAYYTLKLLGAEIPRAVPVGQEFELAHGGFGVVIHSRSTIGDRVKIYPGVTLGRADIYRPAAQSKFEGIMRRIRCHPVPGRKNPVQRGHLESGPRHGGGRERGPAAIHWRMGNLGWRSSPVCGDEGIRAAMKLCLTPKVHGVGGMVSFAAKLTAGLNARGVETLERPAQHGL